MLRFLDGSLLDDTNGNTRQLSCGFCLRAQGTVLPKPPSLLNQLRCRLPRPRLCPAGRKSRVSAGFLGLPNPWNNAEKSGEHEACAYNFIRAEGHKQGPAKRKMHSGAGRAHGQSSRGPQGGRALQVHPRTRTHRMLPERQGTGF